MLYGEIPVPARAILGRILHLASQTMHFLKYIVTTHPKYIAMVSLHMLQGIVLIKNVWYNLNQ